MSLINKMLNDLEKRDAFLDQNQDRILDGLYSAYDLEIDQKRKWYSSSLIFIAILIVILVMTISYYFFSEDMLQLQSYSKVDNDEFQYDTELNKTNIERKISTSISNKKSDIKKQNHFLKLDDSLLLKTPVSTSNSTISHPLNRIEDIFFDKSEQGINLVMKTPGNVDYLVYGLSNPDRVVVEVDNAELGFLLEELEPVEPIVAIRYSINQKNRFKLVLESEQPLTIRKTVSGNNNDLVVFMNNEWQKNIVEKNNNNLPDNSLNDIVEQQVELEKETVYKGELIKTPVDQDVSAYAEKLFRDAYSDYKNGDISNSLKKLNMALDHDAAHVNARSTLATILSRQGHIELAYSILNEGLIQFPDQAEWIKVYARLLLNEGKLVEASEKLAKYSPTVSSNVEYYALKAAILQKLNEHNNSAKIYRDLLQINPLESVWWMGLGISLESLKRYEDALYAYQKASTNTSLAKDSINFISQRITMLSNLIKDESS